MITQNTVKACCGNSTLVLNFDKAIKKSQIKIFKDNSYFIPDNFYQAGIVYFQKDQLIATGSYGATKLTVKCSGQTCESQIKNFINLLEQAINSN